MVSGAMLTIDKVIVTKRGVVAGAMLTINKVIVTRGGVVSGIMAGMETVATIREVSFSMGTMTYKIPKVVRDIGENQEGRHQASG